MPQLSLDRLKVFLAVADEGGFSAAARRIGRSQSAVSHAIAELEADLGVMLFDRSGWKPVLTPDGRTLLAEAREIVERAVGLLSRAEALSQGIEPELSVAVDALVPEGAIVRAVAAVRERFASTTLRLEVGALGAAARAVLDRRCSMGVMASYPSPVKGLKRIEVGHVPLVGVAAPGHPLALAERPIPPDILAEHVQIVLTDPLGSAERKGDIDAEREFGVVSARVWRVADLSIRHRLIREEFGWGNMPLDRVEADLQSGSLVRIGTEEGLPRQGRLPVNAVHRLDAPLRRSGQAFATALEHAMARSAEHGSGGGGDAARSVIGR